jgi:phosphomannomutase
VIAERSVRLDPARGRSAVEALARRPPTELAGRPVTGVEQFPEATLLRLWCGTARLQVRPSGTEPKVKLYGEGVGEDPAPLLDALSSLIV